MIKELSTANKGEIILYKAEDGSTQIDVKMQDETIWLNLNQMTDLFDRDKSVISRHIKNVYQTGELDEDSVVANFATTAADGKTYQVDYYNLDMILSIGYRINSKRGTQFRIWATNVLRQHLLQGYTLHQKRLQEKGYEELQQAIDLIQTTSARHELNTGEASGMLNVITNYMQTWLFLRQYDEEKILVPSNMHKPVYQLTVADARVAVTALKMELTQRKEASDLFGQERDHALEAVIGSIAQTFDNKDLYPTVEEKAAHLLYFIIKDHPFSDGNKRSGVLLFLYFLDKNRTLPSGENALRNNALVSLALLIAESDPHQKDVMLKMIMQFLSLDSKKRKE